MAVIKKKVVRPKKQGVKKVQSKKITYDGITFQSGLECTMYKLLKEAGITCAYEGGKYKTLTPFEYQGECYERVRKTSKEMVNRPKVIGVEYTPDFVGENEEFFIEVKGRANESFPIRWKLFKKMLAENGKNPMLFKPMTVGDCEQVVQILKQKGYGRKQS